MSANINARMRLAARRGRLAPIETMPDGARVLVESFGEVRIISEHSGKIHARLKGGAVLAFRFGTMVLPLPKR